MKNIRTTQLLNQAIKETNNQPSGGMDWAARVILLALLIIILVLTLKGLTQSNTPSDTTFNSNTEVATTALIISPEFENEDNFQVTYYCGCSKCCGKWSDGYEATAYGKQGTQLTPYYSIAVDPDIIPLGTICYDMEGNPYEAVDTGSKIKGNHIDMFVGNHQQAVNLGIKTMQLYW